MEKIRIGIDADYGDPIEARGAVSQPVERIAEAARRVVKEREDVELLLCGNDGSVTWELCDDIPDRITVVGSNVRYHDGLNGGRMHGTSINMLVEMAANGEIDGLFSIGNTANIVSEAIKLRRLPGVRKPALVAHMPSKNGVYVLVDAGATSQNSNMNRYSEAVDSMANEVYTQALMAATYSCFCLNVNRPRVGLLANGEEEKKGSDLVQRTYRLFKEAQESKGLDSFVEFNGMAEPEDAFAGELDVLATDGFTGNVYLKGTQAVAFRIFEEAMERFRRLSWWEKVRLAIVEGVVSSLFNDVFEEFHAARYAGAPLLGFNGVVIKGHGNSNAEAVYYGIMRAIEYVGRHVNEQIGDVLRRYAL